MAKYTVELRSLMEDGFFKDKIDEVLSKYPLYKGSVNPRLSEVIPTREELNEKLLNHYKYREIGFEAPGRFIDELGKTMVEIMPYYNQRFRTVEIMVNIEDPFGNVDVVETFSEKRENTGKSSGTSTNQTKSEDTTQVDTDNDGFAKVIESDTPQNELSIPAEMIDTVPYGNNAQWRKEWNTSFGFTESESEQNTTAKGESTSEGSETVEHTYTKKGNQGVNTYAHDIIEFRQSIIDITQEIINDTRIQDLFFQVF